LTYHLTKKTPGCFEVKRFAPQGRKVRLGTLGDCQKTGGYSWAEEGRTFPKEPRISRSWGTS